MYIIPSLPLCEEWNESDGKRNIHYLFPDQEVMGMTSGMIAMGDNNPFPIIMLEKGISDGDSFLLVGLGTDGNDF